MSPPNSNSPLEPASPITPVSVARRKPRADIYTVMLVLSLIAVLLGILFLYLYNAEYEWKHSGAPPVAMNTGFNAGDAPPPRLISSNALPAGQGCAVLITC